MSAGTRAATVVLAAGALVLQVAAPASAAQVSGPVVGGLIGPLGLAVGPDGTVYAAEAFGGALTVADKHGSVSRLVEGRSEIAGVAAGGRGGVVFVASEPDGSTTLERVLPNGNTEVLAQLGDHEASRNPDQVNTYGFTDLPEECAAQVPDFLGGGRSYTGIVESHPYAVAQVPGGWVVAEAAGNSLVSVARNGAVSTLAVLPPQPVLLTQDAVDAFNESLAQEGYDARVPQCVVGATYAGEPVPTDVEVGPGGLLFVSTLPGFPELPGTGAVSTVDPRTGALQVVSSGFTGATDLAVADDGTVYVTELFAGRLSRLTADGPVTVAELAFPTAVEYTPDGLYVTQIPGFAERDPTGQVVVVRP